MQRIFFFLFLFVFDTAVAQQRFRFSEPKMGAPFQLTFYAADSATAAQLAAGCFHLVDSLNNIFSDYLPQSELTRLNQEAGSGQSSTVSPLLWEMLRSSQQAAKASYGAFDITIGPLSQLWRQARRQKSFPPQDAVTAAKEKTGMKHLVLDTNTRTATLLQKNMQLDLGGIAKGYVAQKVISFLWANGVYSALADAGGDLFCSLPPPGKQGWTVGINRPESKTGLLSETVLLSNSAVATSGDLYQFIEHNGRRYSHIVDPRTGYGVPFQRNVTVIAADGATADWLATACSILSWRKSKKLVKRYGADLLVTQWQRGRLVYLFTPGMKKKLGR